MSQFTPLDQRFMQMALHQAEEAFDAGEVPVGAVVAAGAKLLAKARNQTELLNDVTAHAEIIAITAASQALGSKFLEGCTLYVTIEPCVMCAGALFWARPDRVIFAARDEKRGFLRQGPQLLHPKTELGQGLLSVESSALMQEFFRMRREEG
jgi:tRNA(adenine34) deaminase